MRNLLNKRPTVATVLSLIALFAALGGTSYAAATISGKQVMNGTLTGADIKNNSVGGADVKESRLGQVPKAAKALQAAKADKASQADKATTADSATQAQKALSADSATKASSADAVGPDGVDSAAIKAGAVTAQDLGGTTVREDEIQITSGQTASNVAACLEGERVLMGGTYWADVALNNAANAAQLHLVYSRPTTNGWQARAYNNTGDNDAKLVVYAVCLS